MSEGSTNMLKVTVKDDGIAMGNKQEEGEEKVKLGHSQKMQLDLDEASKMMELSLSLCNNVFDEPSFGGEESTKDLTLTRHSKLDASESSKRLTVLSSLSSSQPGGCGLHQFMCVPSRLFVFIGIIGNALLHSPGY